MAFKERSERIGLPLLLIGRERNKFIGKLRLQKLTYLVQAEAKMDIYNFKKNYYGPFSRELDNDIISSADLVTVVSHPTILDPNRIYYEFRLTTEGKEKIDEIENMLNERTRNRIDDIINKYSALPTNKLLESAYATFKEVDDRLSGLEKSTLNLKGNVHEIFDKCCNRQSLFLLAVIDYNLIVLEKSKKISDDVQKAVILRLAAELFEMCDEAFPEIAPPINSERLRPVFMNIADIWGALIEYCEKRDIVKNPFKLSLENILSEDEALRLQKAVQSIELKA